MNPWLSVASRFTSQFPPFSLGFPLPTPTYPPISTSASHTSYTLSPQTARVASPEQSSTPSYTPLSSSDTTQSDATGDPSPLQDAPTSSTSSSESQPSSIQTGSSLASSSAPSPLPPSSSSISATSAPGAVSTPSISTVSSSSQRNVAAIVAGTISGALFLVLTLLAVWLLKRRRRGLRLQAHPGQIIAKGVRPKSQKTEATPSLPDDQIIDIGKPQTLYRSSITDVHECESFAMSHTRSVSPLPDDMSQVVVIGNAQFGQRLSVPATPIFSAHLFSAVSGRPSIADSEAHSTRTNCASEASLRRFVPIPMPIPMPGRDMYKDAEADELEVLAGSVENLVRQGSNCAHPSLLRLHDELQNELPRCLVRPR